MTCDFARHRDAVICLADNQTTCKLEERCHSKMDPCTGAQTPGSLCRSAPPIQFQHHLVILGDEIPDAHLSVGIQSQDAHGGFAQECPVALTTSGYPRYRQFCPHYFFCETGVDPLQCSFVEEFNASPDRTLIFSGSRYGSSYFITINCLNGKKIILTKVNG